MELISLYIHVPFCVHRCGYCDFNTFAGIDSLIPDYAEAVCREIRHLSLTASERLPIHSIYFGGGTPSLLPSDTLAKILSTIEKHTWITPSKEITLEANPGTVDGEYLKEIHSLGVNRVSIGMQSANQDEIMLLDRQHNFADVIRAVEWTRAAGITNLNLDMIYGLPNQGLKTWMSSLEAALTLKPEHLSLYALTLEEGTPLEDKVRKGILPMPDPDEAADMYEAASDKLAAEGYIQYEISNWAKKAEKDEILACKHNLQYWRNLPYLGVGAGAHGFIDKQRTVNVSSPKAYIQRMSTSLDQQLNHDGYPRTPATVQLQPIDKDAEIGETMMMGLRLVLEGVSGEVFRQRFGLSLAKRFGAQIERLVSFDLLEWSGDRHDVLRLTKRGRLLGNQVFKEFI